MIKAATALLAVALALAAAPRANAACSSAACPDVTTIENVRSLVASACDCAGAKSHGAYVRCAKTVIKGAVKSAQLAKSCKGTALRCEAKSSCGSKNTNVCCAVKRGKVKAKLIRTAARCPGSKCEGQMSLADACTDTGACAAQRRAIRSFTSVQQVFAQSCALASCHSTFSRQGDLVLETEDISFISLINRPSAHPEAKAANLLRVVPGDPENSYLIKKLRGQGPGDAMPQVGGLLPEPVIQMVEDWIKRGARSSEEECRLASQGGNAQQYCDDEPEPIGDYVWEPLAPLDPPPAGTGIQLYVPPKDVVPGTEWETCYAFKPDWKALAAARGMTGTDLPFLKQQTYRMHPGSHHLLLYAYFGPNADEWTLNEFFPCFAGNCENREDCPEDSNYLMLPVGGTQVAGTRYEVKYPDGIGIPTLGENVVLVANLHYTNPFQPQQPIYGEAWLNLDFYAPGEFKATLDGIFAINAGDLFVEPYTSRTISRIWQPRSILTRNAEDAAIFQLFGHMHKRGTEFRIDYVKDGKCSVGDNLCGRDSDCRTGATCVRGPDAEDTTIYYTTRWDHAPVVDFPSPYFRVNKDQGLRWTCTHVNGVEGDPARPPKRCAEGCRACGWNDTSRTCTFNRNGKTYQEGEPMPVVFGELADDDMCNMFGYFIKKVDLPNIGLE